MSAALDKSYDGIIIGAGHHGLVLGSYLAKGGLEDPAGRPAAAIRRRAVDRGGDRAGLLSQPAFDQSFPHHRDAVVQGSRSRRPRRATSRRATSSASRISTARALVLRPRPRGDARQRRALLARRTRRRSATGTAGPRRSPRKIFLPERYSEPLPQAEREALLSQERDRPRLPGGDAAPAVRRGEGAVRERARAASVPVQGVAVRHLAGRHDVEDQPDGLGDPRLRPAERLPALPGRLVQSGARADGDVHRRRRPLRSRRSTSSASSSKAARRPASRCATAARCGPSSSSPRTLDVHQTFESLIGREQLPAAFAEEARRLPVHHVDALRPASRAAREPARFTAEAFDPNIDRTLKWSLGAETMEDLIAAHATCMAGPRAGDRAVRLGAAERASIRPRRRPASTPPMRGT